MPSLYKKKNSKVYSGRLRGWALIILATFSASKRITKQGILSLFSSNQTKQSTKPNMNKLTMFFHYRIWNTTDAPLSSRLASTRMFFVDRGVGVGAFLSFWACGIRRLAVY